MNGLRFPAPKINEKRRLLGNGKQVDSTLEWNAEDESKDDDERDDNYDTNYER